MLDWKTDYERALWKRSGDFALERCATMLGARMGLRGGDVPFREVEALMGAQETLINLRCLTRQKLVDSFGKLDAVEAAAEKRDDDAAQAIEEFRAAEHMSVHRFLSLQAELGLCALPEPERKPEPEAKPAGAGEGDGADATIPLDPELLKANAMQLARFFLIDAPKAFADLRGCLLAAELRDAAIKTSARTPAVAP